MSLPDPVSQVRLNGAALLAQRKAARYTDSDAGIASGLADSVLSLGKAAGSIIGLMDDNARRAVSDANMKMTEEFKNYLGVDGTMTAEQQVNWNNRRREIVDEARASNGFCTDRQFSSRMNPVVSAWNVKTNEIRRKSDYTFRVNAANAGMTTAVQAYMNAPSGENLEACRAAVRDLGIAEGWYSGESQMQAYQKDRDNGRVGPLQVLDDEQYRQARANGESNVVSRSDADAVGKEIERRSAYSRARTDAMMDKIQTDAILQAVKADDMRKAEALLSGGGKTMTPQAYKTLSLRVQPVIESKKAFAETGKYFSGLCSCDATYGAYNGLGLSNESIAEMDRRENDLRLAAADGDPVSVAQYKAFAANRTATEKKMAIARNLKLSELFGGGNLDTEEGLLQAMACFPDNTKEYQLLNRQLMNVRKAAEKQSEAQQKAGRDAEKAFLKSPEGQKDQEERLYRLKLMAIQARYDGKPVRIETAPGSGEFISLSMDRADDALKAARTLGIKDDGKLKELAAMYDTGAQAQLQGAACKALELALNRSLPKMNGKPVKLVDLYGSPEVRQYVMDFVWQANTLGLPYNRALNQTEQALLNTAAVKYLATIAGSGSGKTLGDYLYALVKRKAKGKDADNLTLDMFWEKGNPDFGGRGIQHIRRKAAEDFIKDLK